MNFVQSRIPALVCSLHLEYGCHQARSYGPKMTKNQKLSPLISLAEKAKKSKTFTVGNLGQK